MIIISTQAFPPASGGKQTLMAGLANAAAANNNVIVLADVSRGTAPNQKPCKTPYDIKWFRGIKKMRQLRKARHVVQLTKSNTVSHIFCDSWRSAEYLPKGLSCPIFIYAHGNEIPIDTNTIKAKRVSRVFRKVDHIIAVSPQTAARIQPLLTKTNLPKLHSIPNPISDPITANKDDIDHAESLWPQGGTRLLTLCRLIDWKGVDMTIKALAHLAQKGIEAQLVIAGAGPDQARLEKIVKDKSLSNRVKFAGRVEGGRKTALFDSADIFMQPGRLVGDQCEGFGITYIEAGLRSLPSISGNAGGAPAAIDHARTGLVVDGENLDEIVIALQQLIDEPCLATHMGEAANTKAQTLLWSRQIETLLSLA